MKILILLITLVISGPMLAQGIPVKLNDYNPHIIWAPDTLTAQVVKEYAAAMETTPVDYETGLEAIKRIQVKALTRMEATTRQDSILVLNARLDKFPYCKRAAILQELYRANGGQVDNRARYSMLSNFSVNEFSNAIFKQQYRTRYGINLLVKKLIQNKRNGNKRDF